MNRNDVSTEAEDIVTIRCQAETSEDTEDLATIVVRSRICELKRALRFFVVTSFRSPVNPIRSPDPCLVTKHVTIIINYSSIIWIRNVMFIYYMRRK
jgi:hypothetical protein